MYSFLYNETFIWDLPVMLIAQIRLVFLLDYYHPPTKLPEGNVFICVCLSTWGGGAIWPLPISIGPHCTVLTPWPCPWPCSPPRHETWGLTSSPCPPANDIWCPSLDTRSNMFTRSHCTAPPPPSWYLLAVEEVQSAQAVGTHPTGTLSLKNIRNSI